MYTSKSLEPGLDILGPVRMIRCASLSALDTDFAAHLSDVFPTDGPSSSEWSSRILRQDLSPGSAARLAQLSIPKALGTLALPIALSNALYTGYQFVNAFWVGRLGSAAFAAVSVSWPVVSVLVSLGGGLSAGGAILVAQYAGARDQRMISHVSAQTILIVVVVSVFFSALGCATVRPILHVMNIGPDIFEAAARYMTVSYLGIVFTFSFMMFQSILQGIGEVKMPLYVMALSVLLNLVLDPLFIFGLGPIPAGRVVGAAYATLLSEGVAAAVGFHMLLGHRYGLQLRLTDFAPHLSLSKRVFLLGLPASIAQSTAAIGWTVLTTVVSDFGTEVIAAFGFGVRALTITAIPAIAISTAASTLVGQHLGAGNLARARETGVVSAGCSFSLLTGAAVVVFVGAEVLVRLFIPRDPVLVHEGATVVRFIALSLGFNGAATSFTGALKGAGDTLIPMILSIISILMIQLPLAYGLSHYTSLGATGIWCSFPISAILMTALAYTRFKTHRWEPLVQSTA